MKSFGSIVIALTLLLSAVAVWIYLHRDHTAQSPNRPNAQSTQNAPSTNSRLPDSRLQDARLPDSPRPFVPSPKETVSSAMDETIVKSMISQARTASLKGDAATAGALVNGLKHHRATSEKLLAAEIASAPDPQTKIALEDMLSNLSGEPQ